MVKSTSASDKDKAAPGTKPKREKAKAIEILKVWRTRKRIVIKYNLGDDGMSVRSRDNPLPAFDKALDKLDATVGAILNLPAEYTDGIRIMGIDVHIKGGADAVSIFAQKDISGAAKVWPLHTPERLLSAPSVEGTYSEPLPAKHVDRVAEVIEAAKDYVKGNRAQGQLSLDDEDDEEGEGPEHDDDLTAPLEFDAQATGKAAK